MQSDFPLVLFNILLGRARVPSKTNNDPTILVMRFSPYKINVGRWCLKKRFLIFFYSFGGKYLPQNNAAILHKKIKMVVTELVVIVTQQVRACYHFAWKVGACC